MKYTFYYIFAMLVFVIACSDNESTSPNSDSSSTNGQGGSLARFTIAKSHLYIVDDTRLHTFEIDEATGGLTEKGSSYIGFGTETIFPKGDNLLLGTQFGMVIYDIQNPSDPKYVSEISHIRSCDPVVAQENVAYVTISNGSRCNWGDNRLILYDISDLESPREVNSYDMDNPQGLGVKDTLLLVADNGLKLYDINSPDNVALIHTEVGADATDIIPLDNSWLVVGKSGMYQYQTVNSQLERISQITAYEN